MRWMFLKGWNAPALSTAFLLSIAGAPAQAGPTAVITPISTSGMAPFAVHAHALNTGLTSGDQNSTLYEWDFGDPNGQYNKLRGFNAAHVYDNPGNYTLTLRVTDQNGQVSTATRSISVSANTRGSIYLSAAGNDANNGSSSSSPIRTMARAQQLIGNNKQVLLRRGDTFTVTSQFEIVQTNVLIGAWGSGNRPVLNCTSGAAYHPNIKMGQEANSIVIEDVVFDSPYAASGTAPRGVLPNGTNVTIRRCLFDSLGDAMSANCVGWLTMQNTANYLGGYFAWSAGSDHTHLGNVTSGSINEHMFRLANASRVNLAYNDLYNQYKTNVWCMLGTDVYASHNKFRTGRFVIGPNYANTSPSERFNRVVIDANEFVGNGIVFYHGANQVSIRNNVIEDTANDAISIWGYNSQYNRSNDDIRIHHNTGINYSNSYGKLVKIGSGTTRVSAIGNMYYAPSLNTAYAASNVTSDSSNLSTHTFRNNLWATPHNGSHVHGLSTGAVSVSQWDSFAETTNEMYRYFNNGDINSAFSPQFNASVVAPTGGVFTDFQGKYRPASNWAIGAFDPNATAGGGSTPPPPPPPPPPPGTTIRFDMESTAGWSAQFMAMQPGYDGQWERGVPAGDGTRGDPTEDFDGSGQCWLTANRIGNSDVDMGPFTLNSPIIDMSAGNATVRFAAWFHNTSMTDEDRLNVYVSNNGGSTWVLAKSIAHGDDWEVHSFAVGTFVNPTSQMKLKFVADDSPNDSVTEVAIDDVQICFGTNCGGTSGVPGDANGDGNVDVTDLLAVMNGWGTCGSVCPGDLNGSGAVTTDDLLMVINNWD